MTHENRPTIWRPAPRADVEPPFDAKEVAAWKRRVYGKFDIASFDRKAKEFWKRDLADPSFDIVQEVDHVLRSHPSGTLLVPYHWDEIPVGTRLWRARELKGVAGRSFEVTESDLWEPPAKLTSAGR